MNQKAKDPGTIKRFAGKGVFPHQLALTLLFPLRGGGAGR